MSFELRKYYEPDFSEAIFQQAPNAKLVPVEIESTAPAGFHAMSIFPEYFKVDGQWLLAEESRMDCIAVYEAGKILVKEFRKLQPGELVVVGRTENCEDGIYVHANGFREVNEKGDVFAFRGNRSRETAFSRDYDEKQAERPRQPFCPRHRDQRAGFYRNPGKGPWPADRPPHRRINRNRISNGEGGRNASFAI